MSDADLPAFTICEIQLSTSPGPIAPSFIAAKYGVSTNDFLKWNGLTRKSVLHIGDEYVIHLPVKQADAVQLAKAESKNMTEDGPTPKSFTHTVASGQNPTTIARRYGVKVEDIFRWNGWKKGHIIYPGDEVVIVK